MNARPSARLPNDPAFLLSVPIMRVLLVLIDHFIEAAFWVFAHELLLPKPLLLKVATLLPTVCRADLMVFLRTA